MRILRTQGASYPPARTRQRSSNFELPRQLSCFICTLTSSEKRERELQKATSILLSLSLHRKTLDFTSPNLCNLLQNPKKSSTPSALLLISTLVNPRFISSTFHGDPPLLCLSPPDVSPRRKCSFSHLLVEAHPSILGRSKSPRHFQKRRDFPPMAEATEPRLLSDARSSRCEAAEDDDRPQVPVLDPVGRERVRLARQRFRMVIRKPSVFAILFIASSFPVSRCGKIPFFLVYLLVEWSLEAPFGELLVLCLFFLLLVVVGYYLGRKVG